MAPAPANDHTRDVRRRDRCRHNAGWIQRARRYEREAFDNPTLRLEFPSPMFKDINPLMESGPERVAASVEAQRLKQFALRTHCRSVWFATKTVRQWLNNSTDQTDTQLSRGLSLPTEWNRDQRREFNLAQYQKYVRSMHALAGLHGLKDAYFIQPCPAIGKHLTPE